MSETVLNQNQIASKVYTGFNEKSYIQFNNSFSKPTTSFEFGTRINRTTDSNFFCICGSNTDQLPQGGMFFRNWESWNDLRVWWCDVANSGWCGDLNGGSNSSTGLFSSSDVFQWVYIKMVKESAASNVVFYKSYNGTNWTQGSSISSGGKFLDPPEKMCIGCSGEQITYARGFIDMAHTYVKVDGQLVLNGADRSQYKLIGDVIAL